jgi:hypothetical protein
MYNFNEGGNINLIAKVVEKISLAAVPEYIQKYISADPFLIAQSKKFYIKICLISNLAIRGSFSANISALC